MVIIKEKKKQTEGNILVKAGDKIMYYTDNKWKHTAPGVVVSVRSGMATHGYTAGQIIDVKKADGKVITLDVNTLSIDTVNGQKFHDSVNKDKINEKLTNFTRVIKDNAYKNAVANLGDIVNRNKNIQFFIDAGEEPAVILAYLSGTIEGILDYAAFMSADKQAKIKKIAAWLTSVEPSIKKELTTI